MAGKKSNRSRIKKTRKMSKAKETPNDEKRKKAAEILSRKMPDPEIVEDANDLFFNYR